MNINLGVIANEIGCYLVKYGRIPVTQTKEKYGTIRVYCSFGVYNLHSLIWPRYVYKHRRYPKWLWNLDVMYISKLFSLVQVPIYKYQKFIYKRAYKLALAKHPEAKRALLSGADYGELL